MGAEAKRGEAGSLCLRDMCSVQETPTVTEEEGDGQGTLEERRAMANLQSGQDTQNPKVGLACQAHHVNNSTCTKWMSERWK